MSQAQDLLFLVSELLTYHPIDLPNYRLCLAEPEVQLQQSTMYAAGNQSS